MNANAKKWVRALRSGKYKQGREWLRAGDTFCCLGVACELAIKAKVISRTSPAGGNIMDYAGKRAYYQNLFKAGSALPATRAPSKKVI